MLGANTSRADRERPGDEICSSDLSKLAGPPRDRVQPRAIRLRVPDWHPDARQPRWIRSTATNGSTSDRRLCTLRQRRRPQPLPPKRPRLRLVK
jgi:hypothetical protein